MRWSLFVTVAWFAWGCARGESPGPTVDVMVAEVDLPAGATLAPTNVAKRAVPSTLASPNWVRSERAAEVLGSTTPVALTRGDPILRSTLAVSPVNAPSNQVAEGTRLEWAEITTPIALTETVRPGDHVDLIGLIKDPNTNQMNASATLEDVLVVAVRARAVGLQLDPRDANRLALLSELGFLRLTVRRPGDTQRADAGAVDVTSLVP